MTMEFSHQSALSYLAKKYQTPLYVYNAEKIEEQYHKLKKAFAEASVRIKYACKALTNINILKLLNMWGSDLDAVSINEVKMGLLAGFSPQRIIFTPNSVSFAEIAEAYKENVVINIDSLSILEKYAHHFPNSSCCLRFNPDLIAGGNEKIRTGHAGSKFGIPKNHMEHVLEIVSHSSIQVIGLHIHAGSEILHAETFFAIADSLYEIAKHFPNLQFLDLGSGFKVPYKKQEAFTNIEEIASKLTPHFLDFCKSYGRDLELWFEPGKYIVSESGYLLVTANQIKQGNGKTFVGVDSGQNHLLRPMLYDSYHEIINLSNIDGAEKIYDVVGYICEEDTFAKNRSIAEIREGDLLCILNAGAYGFSMSSNYNSRFRPAEVLWYNKKDYLIRRRETWEDLIRNQIILDIL